MTLGKRIGKVFGALAYLLCVFLLYRMGEDGFMLVCMLMSLSLILFGVRNLLFYFTMARHMVNGKAILYVGVIGLDFGIFSMTISRNQLLAVVLYLLGARAFAGVVDILRAREARRHKAPSWRFNLAEGIANIATAAATVVFGLGLGNMRAVAAIYSLGLVYSAVLNLISACQKTAIVYIP